MSSTLKPKARPFRRPPIVSRTSVADISTGFGSNLVLPMANTRRHAKKTDFILIMEKEFEINKSRKKATEISKNGVEGPTILLKIAFWLLETVKLL